MAEKKTLQEPYHDPETVTDELVDVLLTPLLIKGIKRQTQFVTSSTRGEKKQLYHQIKICTNVRRLWSSILCHILLGLCQSSVLVASFVEET